ncbi:MAG: glycosyltransferase [Bacteroidales bacterium]|nr:glycosyltransferase [Bacteroidales bacterium]
MKKVSIIIPVYNAEKFLPECFRNLAALEYDDVELCFVDDGSADGSLRLLEDFAQTFTKGEVKVLRHEKNRGVAAARNTALDNAAGEYIMHIDCDDGFKPEIVSRAVAEAESEDIDMLGFDCILESPTSSRYFRQPDCPSADYALETILKGTRKWNLWLYLTKRSLYEGVRFVEGDNLGEDMMVTSKLFAKAEKVGQIHEALYIYRQSPVSVSYSFTDEKIGQIKRNLENLSGFLEAGKPEIAKFIPFLKLNLKLPLLMTGEKADYLKWKGLFPEADRHIMENDVLAKRTNIVQKCASLGLWPIVKAYWFIVTKVYYRNGRA